jgi:hypothetical protein
MEHPLIPNLDSLSADELMEKINELNKKLGIAYKVGNHHLCNQICMALENYQNKYQEKIRNVNNKGTSFDGVIDIS